MAHRPSSLSIRSALWLLLASSAHQAAAVPYPRDDLHAAGYGYLAPRQCPQYCGYNDMYCCQEGTQCYTSNGIAGCSAVGGGGWAWYTTTWTLTQTFTKTYNSFIPAATGPSGGGDCVPPPGSGQKACGEICCASWQYCASRGQCAGPDPTGVIVPTAGTPSLTMTTQFSAPYRVTGTEAPTDTAAGASETTTGVSPGGTSSGLSGGAIAGIVVGTIAGVALLLLICACCVVRGLWHGLLALLGLGKKKKTESIIEEERYHRRGSTHSHRDNHSSWFGGRPSSAGARNEKSKGAGLLGLGAALGTLALLLGLRRDKKKKAQTHTRSDVSSSYWSDSYTATDPSE